MKPARKLTFTLKARIDLREIVDYTEQKWGEGQAEKYFDKIMGKCRDLAAGLVSGRKRAELKGSPSSYPVGSHIIFYQETKRNIRILRILHGARDLPRHFNYTPAARYPRFWCGTPAAYSLELAKGISDRDALCVFGAAFLDSKNLNAKGVTHLSPGFVQALDTPWITRSRISKNAEGVQQKAAPIC